MTILGVFLLSSQEVLSYRIISSTQRKPGLIVWEHNVQV